MSRPERRPDRTGLNRDSQGAWANWPLPASRPGPASRASGFTLLEVVVAAAILAVGLTAVMAAYGGSVRLMSQASGYELARLEAERLMAEVLAAPQKAPFARKGDCARPPGARYTLTGAPDQNRQGLTTIRVSVTFTESGGERTLALQTAQADPALPVVTGTVY